MFCSAAGIFHYILKEKIYDYPAVVLTLPHHVFWSWGRSTKYKLPRFESCSQVFKVKCGKKLSLCHKLWFSNFYIFATQWLRPQIFKTINSVRWKNLSLKYQKYTPGGKNMCIRKSEFVTKTQFRWQNF